MGDSGEEGNFQVMTDTVQSTDNEAGFNGHINRNIRLAMAMIDMSKPYIFIERILPLKIEGEDVL